MRLTKIPSTCRDKNIAAEDWVACAIFNMRSNLEVAEWNLYEALAAMEKYTRPPKRFKKRLEELRFKYQQDSQ